MPLSGRLLAAGSNVEGLLQFGEFGLAFVLSAIVGIERELRQKNAGLKTHTLVGAGAALFMLVSKYGFSDVLQTGRVVVDPSRMAAQIVTGVGFLGAGLIFIRGNGVRGLTTAASIWVTAAVGAAAGAGLPYLAVLGTGAYLLVALGFMPITRKLPSSGSVISTLQVRYPDGRGVLREVVELTTSHGFDIDELSSSTHSRGEAAGEAGDRTVEVALQVHGTGSVTELAAALTELPHVQSVVSNDANVTAPN